MKEITIDKGNWFLIGVGVGGLLAIACLNYTSTKALDEKHNDTTALAHIQYKRGVANALESYLLIDLLNEIQGKNVTWGEMSNMVTEACHKIE